MRGDWEDREAGREDCLGWEKTKLGGKEGNVKASEGVILGGRPSWGRWACFYRVVLLMPGDRTRLESVYLSRKEPGSARRALGEELWDGLV